MTSPAADDNPFQSLDFVYVPTDDVARDAADLIRILGGRLVFAIEEWNTRVAMIALTPDPPHLLLTDHLEGERPILIYRGRQPRRGCHPGESSRLDVGRGV